MNLSLHGRYALVGGSTQGIGYASAVELAAMGANVSLLARNAETLQQACQQLPNNGNQQHQYIVANFNHAEQLTQVVAQHLSEQSLPYTILVNNTGGPAGGAIAGAQAEQFLAAYEAHLLVSHALTQLLLPSMKAAAWGRIINIISTSVKEPLANLGVSNTTRWAVAAWAKTLAGELGAYGITVNNVLPGFTDTQRLQSIIEQKAQATQQTTAQVSQQMMTEVPLRRFAAPSEVAAAVGFLASPAANYISGINLPVDGGRTRSL